MLVPLRELIGALSIYDQVPQIEVAVGEEARCWCCASWRR
jgi:23S rRNA (uracil1939-C5)-methyltransferase